MARRAFLETSQGIDGYDGLMTRDEVDIRPETPRDVEAIHEVTVAAFQDTPHAGHTEQFIVKALRKAGVLAVSLVAELDGEAIGHVAVSPVTISNDTSSGIEGWFGLGPISVRPDVQGRGVGSRLMHAALDELRRERAAGCVLLGDPGYYGRFGFRAEPGLVLPDVPPKYFQALAFDGAVPEGVVSYHDAFGATS